MAENRRDLDTSPASDVDPTVDGFLQKVAATAPHAQPREFTGTERYQLGRRLGEGGFGIVFEAIDRAQGGRVALKVLRHAQPRALYRFKHEFRALADVLHPNLVRLYELSTGEHEAFFTMELVDGRPLAEHIGGSIDRARDCLRQLAAGLNALHRAGKLHRDVKPSNVMVDGGGRVVLLDFGLAQDLAANEAGEMAGTPLYMSPEQCAHRPLTAASDWYALGVILYELLAGCAPFAGSALEIFAAKQNTDPEPPSRRVPDLPPELEALCLALLRRDPTERPTATEILSRLEAPGLAPVPIRADLFVGRTAELAALLAKLGESAERRTVLLVSGPSGIGKSALIKRSLDQIRLSLPEALILSGRCYERESVPYKALDEVVDELGLWLSRLAESERAALLPGDHTALTRLFPVLSQIPELQRRHDQPQVSGADTRRRGMAELRALFTRLAERRPVIVCVDDLQWGDADSAVLLAELLRAPDPPAVCFVGAFREDEAGTSPFLSRLAQLREVTLADLTVHELRLGALSLDEASLLAATLLGAEQSARAQAVAVESGGSPFFLHELAHHSEAGPVGLGRLLGLRVGRLDPASRRLLEVVSVIGRPVEADLVAQVAELGESLKDALGCLRNQRLLRARERRPSPLVESYHDRIREEVVGSLDPAHKRALHLGIAATLESRKLGDAAEIALHLRDGGDPARALGYTVRGADEATAKLAFVEAVRLRRIALELAPLVGPEVERLPLELALAEALSTAGHGRDAAELFQKIAPNFDERRGLDLRRRAAEELLNNGYIEEGYAAATDILQRVGLSPPHGQVGMVARVLLGRARIALAGQRFRERDPRTVPDNHRLRADMLAGMSMALWWMDPVKSVLLHNENLLLTLRMGDRGRAMLALSFEVLVSAFRGTRAKKVTQARLSQAREVCAGLGQVEALAHLRTVEGTVAFLEGRWQDAFETLGEVDQPLTTVEQSHGSQNAHLPSLRLLILYWMGRAGDLLRALPAAFRAFEERQSFLGWTWAKLLEAWALGISGRVDEGRAAAAAVRDRLPEVTFESQRWWLDYAEVQFHLTEGDGEAARRSLERVWPQIGRGFTGQQRQVAARWLRARSALACAVGRPAGSERKRLIAEARRLARWLEREGAPWAEALGRSLFACAAAADGDDAETLRLLAEAERLLEVTHLESALAAVRMALGRRLGGESGRALVQKAEAWMARQQVSEAGNWAQLPIGKLVK